MVKLNEKNILEHLKTYTWQELEGKTKEIQELYAGALKDERETFSEYRRNRRSGKARENYYEAVQRLGGIQEVLELLNIDYTE